MKKNYFKINLSKYLNNKFNFINTYYDLKSYNKKKIIQFN